MRESFKLKSEIISGSVEKEPCSGGINIEISIKIHTDIPPDCVVRAYFASRSTKELTPIGIVDNFGHLTAFIKDGFYTDTIVFGIKNTITDAVEYVGYAYLNGEWTLDGDPAVENAKKILDDIKQNCNHMTNEMKQNILDEINRNLEPYDEADINFQNFKIYKITDFKPILSISAVKYAMFERSAMYSFDNFSHYLFGICENRILIAFKSENGENPILHMDTLCTEIKAEGALYFAVIIELADDGQYFVKD